MWTACNDDDSVNTSGGDPVSVHFTLSTRATSATGIPQNPVPELGVERFNHYWVVFTDRSNRIVAIAKKDCSLTEQDEFTVELSPSTYYVYGFANIADSYLEGLGIALDSPMPDLGGVLFAPDSRFFGNGVTALLPVEVFQSDYAAGQNMGIPMTSRNRIEVNITDAITVEQSIEVVRMFAKIEFVFDNATPSDLSLRSLAVSNLTLNKADATGVIPLMNDDSRDLDYLQDAPYGKLKHTLTGDGLTVVSGGSSVSKSFYVLESVADAVTNSFMLDFDIVKTGESPTDEIDYMRYGLTDPSTLTAIRRNDWIRIPITINDWVMRLEARSYPPIGGYPDVVVEEDESNEFTVTFSSPGDFVLRPFFRKFFDGSDWFGIDNADRIAETPVISISGDVSVFAEVPSIKSTGEILGIISSTDGTAVVTMTAKVYTNAEKTVTRTLTRKIYIIKK